MIKNINITFIVALVFVMCLHVFNERYATMMSQIHVDISRVHIGYTDDQRCLTDQGNTKMAQTFSKDSHPR